MAYKIDNCDGAILGVTVNSDYENVMVYSVERIVKCLMEFHGWESQDAWDWFDYNIATARVGSTTPVLVYEDYELFLEE